MVVPKKKDQLNFNSLFIMQNIVLNINGGHPFIPKDLKWFPKFFIMHALLTIQSIAMGHNLIYHSIKDRKYQAICADGSANIVFFLVTLMYVILIINQNELSYLLNCVKKDYNNAKMLPQHEYDIMVKYNKKAFMISKIWSIFVIIGGAGIPLQAVFLTLYSQFFGDKKVYSIYDLHFPGLTEGTRVHFYVVNSLYLYTGFHASVTYIGVIPLGPMFMMHASGQLEILAKRMLKLFPDTGFSVEETNEELKNIVKTLIDIYKFVDAVQRSFEYPYEIILKGAAILMPLLAFTISWSFANDREVSTQCLAFLFGALVISIIICVSSNELYDCGEAFRYSIYDCGWEKYWDRKSRKTLLIMLTRAVRPIVIRTMFRPINLETLADIFKESYTYFNLLCAVFNK